MISEEIKKQLKKIFENLIDPVNIILDKDNSNLSHKIEKLLKDIASLSEKINFDTKDLYCTIKPCIALNSEIDFGIRYMGLPSGGEFNTFIETILMVSKNEYDLTERTVEILEMLDNPVEIKVFITKSCGWCPLVLKKMYSFAMANNFIKTYAVDCNDFPDFAVKYNVSTVPKVVINDKIEFVGFKEENEILGYIMSAGM